jgi:transposase
MSNKELYDKEEVLERQRNHLARTLEEMNYVEISKTEYEKVKKSSDTGYGITLRIGFKYFKRKPREVKKDVGYIDLT